MHICPKREYSVFLYYSKENYPPSRRCLLCPALLIIHLRRQRLSGESGDPGLEGLLMKCQGFDS